MNMLKSVKHLLEEKSTVFGWEAMLLHKVKEFAALAILKLHVSAVLGQPQLVLVALLIRFLLCLRSH